MFSVLDGCIRDPLAAVRAANKLVSSLQQLGYEVAVNNSQRDLKETKLAARNTQPTPYFDEKVSGLTEERFYWIRMYSETFPIAAFQAFRLDFVATSLADWAPAYTIGLYMRRGEMLVPHDDETTHFGIPQKIRGRLAYSGELWISPQIRNRVVFENFSKLGLILTLLKWNPDSIWALTDRSIATHGHPARSGFTSLEAGFLRWKWAGQDIPTSEWLHIAERNTIERSIDVLNASD